MKNIVISLILVGLIPSAHMATQREKVMTATTNLQGRIGRLNTPASIQPNAEQAAAITAIRADILTLVEAGDIESLSGVLAATEPMSQGREIICDVLLNTNNASHRDLPVLTGLFVFAVREAEIQERPRGKYSAPNLKRLCAERISNILRDESASEPDLYERPLQWLKTKLQAGLKRETTETIRSTIEKALQLLSKPVTPAEVNAPPEADSTKRIAFDTAINPSKQTPSALTPPSATGSENHTLRTWIIVGFIVAAIAAVVYKIISK